MRPPTKLKYCTKNMTCRRFVKLLQKVNVIAIFRVAHCFAIQFIIEADIPTKMDSVHYHIVYGIDST